MTTHTAFQQWRPHPWHGLSVGPEPPSLINAYIETCPSDFVKYEVDKDTGYLRVDRPHRTSSQHPALYGFIPRTLCADRVCELMPGATCGDADPLDICVLSERPITRAEVILTGRIVGGLPMLDGGEADDKLIAVLKDDPVWGGVRELDELPAAFVARLRHYFLTYKLAPEEVGAVSIADAYGAAHAQAVLLAAMADYDAAYGPQ